jgi:excisionase family DNA binding protein
VEKFLTVKEFATRTNKSEETIKRWIRSGKIPNAIKESDKKGWRIPESDFNLGETIQNSDLAFTQTPQLSDSHHNEKELVNLAYQAVTMTYPTEEILNDLTNIGIKKNFRTTPLYAAISNKSPEH